MKAARSNVFKGMSETTLSHLVSFGNNLNVAIKRREKRQEDIAQAVFISLPTLRRALRGDPTVSMGVYLAILSHLQLDEQIADLADPSKDEIGLALFERTLPNRIRVKGNKYDF